jgi:hypothetical protein
MLTTSFVLLAMACFLLLGMADVYRYRYGDTSPIAVAYKSGTAIELGDLCFLDSADGYTAKPAGSFTWVAATATPSAPTGATETGAAVSSLTSGATGIKVAYVFPWGEGTLSSAGSVNVTGNGDAIRLDGIDMSALPSGTRRAVYVETAQGSGTYKLWMEDSGGASLITGYGVGRTPPTAAAQDATAMSQYGFGQAFAGHSAQSYDGSTGSSIPIGVKDGKVRIDTEGVFEFDCASTSFNAGDLVGPAKASGNTLEPQKVVSVSHELLAVGRVQEATSSATKVKVRIRGRATNLNR